MNRLSINNSWIISSSSKGFGKKFYCGYFGFVHTSVGIPNKS